MDLLRKFKRKKIQLMRKGPFVQLAPIMMMGETKMSTDVPTAACDGRNEWYNPEFIWSFDNEDLAVGFIIVHENMHKAARHFIVYEKLTARYGHEIVNVGMDYWINLRIKLADPNENYVAMPMKDGKQVGCFDIKYKGKTVLEIVLDLVQQAQDKKEDAGDESKGAGGDKPEGKSAGGDDTGSGPTSFDDHDWDGAKKMSPEEVKKHVEEVKQNIRQGHMAAQRANAGTGAGGDVLGLMELSQSKVDWRKALQEFMQSTCAAKQESSWARPNRRLLHQGIIMPSMRGESIRELVFARDASYSMFHDSRLEKVTGQMVALVKALHIEVIHVMDWDGEVSEESYDTFDSDTFINAPACKRVTGGGGTDPDCVSKFIKRKKIKPDAVIMLTDGEISNWSEWSCPVLWVIANAKKITAPVGKTINVEDF